MLAQTVQSLSWALLLLLSTYMDVPWWQDTL